MINVLDFSKFGSEKELLSAAAKAMDSIRNGSEYEGVVLSDVMTSEEIKTFTDYVGELIMPYIKEAVMNNYAKVDRMEEDTIQNLAMQIFKNFDKFNNSKTKEYGETFEFSTFVKLYLKDAIRKTRAQERGYKERLDRKRRKIARARALAAETLCIDAEGVSVEQIYEFMPLVTTEPLSLSEIHRTLNEYIIEYSMDDDNHYNEEDCYDDIHITEDEIVKKFQTFFSKMRPMQKYIFLQTYGFCSKCHQKLVSNEIGFDPVLIMLGKEDENGQAHIKQDGGEHLDAHYIRKEKERMTIRMRKLVKEMDYDEEQLRSNLFPLIYELQEELSRRYNL